MSYTIFIISSAIVLTFCILFVAYYFMLWPFQPTLEVDDPVISEWLQQDGVVIYRAGEELTDSRLYIVIGERIEGGCKWRVSPSGSDDRVISREAATNHNTCEVLMEEGRLID